MRNSCGPAHCCQWRARGGIASAPPLAAPAAPPPRPASFPPSDGHPAHQCAASGAAPPRAGGASLSRQIAKLGVSAQALAWLLAAREPLAASSRGLRSSRCPLGTLHARSCRLYGHTILLRRWSRHTLPKRGIGSLHLQPC